MYIREKVPFGPMRHLHSTKEMWIAIKGAWLAYKLRNLKDTELVSSCCSADFDSPGEVKEGDEVQCNECKEYASAVRTE